MEVLLPLDKMSSEDKIRTMEILWDDLYRKADSIPSPVWHKEILDNRENALKNGDDGFIDWSKAKK